MSKKKLLLHTVKKLAAALDPAAKATTTGADDPPWIHQVAMLTGVLAALAGILTVRMTSLTNDAIYESNQAILAQTESSDTWAEYQANSIKARIVETQLIPSSRISTKDRQDLSDIDNDLRNRQPALKQTATDKAAERNAHLSQGLARLSEKDLLGYASLAAQLGIALASVAALVKKRSAFHAGVSAGIIGIVITAYAFGVHYLGW